MTLGEVFYWETDKAKGHDLRHKYHVFICDADWQEDITFLFISSDDNGGDYKINNPPYTFLPKPYSFVSCNSIVAYSDDELGNIGSCIGCVSKAHLLELHNAISNSFTMEGRNIKRVCNAIRQGCP